jgi:hypothetical protein
MLSQPPQMSNRAPGWLWCSQPIRAKSNSLKSRGHQRGYANVEPALSPGRVDAPDRDFLVRMSSRAVAARPVACRCAS